MQLEKQGINPIFQFAKEERKSYTSLMNKVLSVFIYIVSSICAAHAEDEKVVLGSLYCGTEYAAGITYGMTIRKAAGNDNIYDIIWTLPWNDKSYVNTGKFKLKELTKDSVIFIRDDFGEYKASIDSSGNFLNGTWRNFKNPERNGPTPGIWELIKVKTSPDCVVIKKTDESPVRRRKVIPIPQKQEDSVKEVELKEADFEFEKHSYKFIPKKEGWLRAKKSAEKMGGYLVVINSEDEEKYLEKKIQEIFGVVDPRVWIGLNDIDEEGKWAWVNGDKLTYTKWHNGEPNNNCGHPESCVLLDKRADYGWNDGAMDSEHYYIVEKD